MKKLAVVALGGNALLRGDQKGTIEDQQKNARDTSERLSELIKNDYNLVITHGNGPQVGNILLSNSAGNQVHGLPDMPLYIAVAYSQGFIAYTIEQQLRDILNESNLEKDIISLVTQVLVDKHDTAFQHPTKPVGPYYPKEEADKITEVTGAKFAEDPRGRGWRKVVASPKPLEITNQKTIEKLARNGQIVIAVGGGGIPAFQNGNKIEGIDAVIDKDLASSLLASEIHADEFYILTDVPKVCINYNTPEQVELNSMTVEEATKHLADGQFAEGSMAPKVRAVVAFVEKTGKDAIITNAANLGTENGGTRITK